jgi:hypothetical protein
MPPREVEMDDRPLPCLHQDRDGCRRPPHGAAVRYSVKSRPAAVLLEGASELGARTDLELPEDAAEVSLDRVLGHEERLRDLAVGHPFGGQARDAQFRGGEVAAALGGVSARAGTGGDEFIVGARGDRLRTAGTGQFERLAEWLARVGAPAGAADRGAQLEPSSPRRSRRRFPSRRRDRNRSPAAVSSTTWDVNRRRESWPRG